MKKHYVYFYGSTKLVLGHNSMSDSSVKMRNQLVGFDGIDNKPELVEFGERCFNHLRKNGRTGETGTLYPNENITIVPFSYFYNEEFIVTNLEDVIEANEQFIHADSMGFPLMNLKNATAESYDYMGKDSIMSSSFEIEFKKKWCCFGHYYLHLLKKAFGNKGYLINGLNPEFIKGNLNGEVAVKPDGTRLFIYADAGM
jgi:hypothetical protein